MGGTAGILVAGTTYACIEAGWSHVVHRQLQMPALPVAFRGLRIAFLTDIHHGPWTSLAYIRACVAKANELKPDLILLGGDYCHNGSEYIRPSITALGALKAPLGVFAVLGNHDHYHGAELTRDALEENSIGLLLNEGVWLKRGGGRLCLAGVDDFWMGNSKVQPALEGVGKDERCLLVSHNPDFVEQLHDPRVGLMLSGHTHGGQVVFPLVGAPIVPSWYGQKYCHGLIQTPNNLLFVSRGLGTITPPVRFRCRPEINLLELA